ncbi:MAG: hypothetical protein K2G56_03095, partial [Eubacterium sp.]|nr:hypothetical protein [Eubacterium sp.]
MISINSSSNFLSALKNNFRRHIAIFSVFQIFAVSVSVFHIFSEFEYYKDYTYSSDLTKLFSEQSLTFIAVVLSLEAFILVAVMFRGIYSKRASDYYFSLPVKRSAWFNANFLFGVISFAVSYAIVYIIGLITFNSRIFRAFRFIHLEAGEFLKYVLMSFAAVIVLYTVFVMCAVIAGRMWQYILLSFISSAVFYTGILGFICYLNTIYGGWINLSEAYTVSSLNLAFSNVTDMPAGKFLISATVQFAVFYAAGYFSFRKRKTEVAENKLSGRVLPIVLTVICFLAEVLISLGLGNEFTLFSRIIAAVILVVVTAVILSAIFFRKAMSKPVLASMVGTVVISAVCILAVQIVPEKVYVNVVPEKDEIETVAICNYGSSGSSSITDILYGSSYLDISDDFGNYGYYIFSTDEAKDKILQLHKKLLSDDIRDNIYSDDYYETGNTSLSIEYKLKSGKVIKRFYDVSSKAIVDEYIDVFKTDEGMNHLEIFRFKPEDILFVTAVEFFDDVLEETEHKDTVFIENVDVSKLCECIKKDFKEANSYRFIDETSIEMNTGDVYDTNWYGNLVDWDFDLYLSFYQFRENISKDTKEKLKKLSSKEMLKVNDEQDSIWLEDNYFYINIDEDTN